MTGIGSSGARLRVVTALVARGDAAAAQALGVGPARIVVLDTPTDTAQEAYAVREFLGTEARFVLVTSASHLPRSVRHLERAGLEPSAAPTHVLTGRGRSARLSKGRCTPTSAVPAATTEEPRHASRSTSTHESTRSRLPMCYDTK